MGSVVVNPIGGLANRMRAIASSVNLAKDCGIHEVKVVWRVNDELAARFEDIFLPVPEILISYPSSLAYTLFYSPPRKKNLFFSALTIRRFGLYISDFSEATRNIRSSENADARILDKTMAVLNSGNDCYLQSGCIFYRFSDKDYIRLFKFKPEIEDKAIETINNLGGNVVGIHIRRTDNSQSILHSPDSLFFEEIDKRIAEDPKICFYLATDDESVKQSFKNKYGERLTTSSRPATRSSKEGIFDAAVEMCILSRTKEIIGSHYSSFSEAASLIGSTPLIQVYRHNTPAMDN